MSISLTTSQTDVGSIKSSSLNSNKISIPSKVAETVGAEHIINYDNRSSSFAPILSEEKCTIFYQNFQYVTNKIELLQDLISHELPEVLCLAEHGLKSCEITIFENLFNYKIVSVSSRSKFKGGGTMIMVKEQLFAHTIDFPSNLCEDKDFEVSACLVKTKKYEIIIVVIYKSPSGDSDVFLQNLNELLAKYYLKSKIILVGDFNVDFKIDCNKTNDVLNLLKLLNLSPTIFEDTRVTEYSATRIDNLFTNMSPYDFYSSVMFTALSDHHAILCTLKNNFCTVKKNTSKFRCVRRYDEINMATMKASCSDKVVDLSTVTPTNYISFIAGLHNNFFPRTRVVFKHMLLVNPSRVAKQEHYRVVKELSSELKRTRDPQNFDRDKYLAIKYKLKTLKITYRNLLIEEKATRVKSFLQNSSNISRDSWKVINCHASGKSSSTFIDRISKDGMTIENPIEIANHMNNFFAAIMAKNNDVNIIEENFDYIPKCPSTFYPFPVLPETVEKIIDKLKNKKSEDHLGLSNAFIKKIKSVISSSLATCINDYLSTGFFPDILKTVKVMPLFKSGNMLDPNNYRPLAQISPLSKVYEHVLCNQMNRFIKVNNLLYEHQYGFRPHLSTESAISCCYDSLTSQEKLHTVVVAVDLKKAFDSVHHGLLKLKLTKFGFGNQALNCISNYLLGRAQFVQFSDGDREVQSNLTEILGGIPQGSVVGPPIFLIFNNDLPLYVKLKALNRVLSKFKILLFADDVLFVISNKDLEQLEIDTFILLNIFCQWADLNFFQFNADKTKCMLMTKRNIIRHFRLFIGDKEIEMVTLLKYLGILLENNFSFDSHVNNICNKLHSAIFVLKVMAKYSELSVLFMVYHSLFMSHINYCLLVWSNCKISLVQKVFILQKKALRTMLQLPYHQSCREYFRKHNLLTVPSLIIYRLIMNFIKETSTAQPIAQGTCGMTTRYAAINSLTQNSHCLKRGQKFFNKLPNELKKCSREKVFKNKLKQYFIESCYYSETEFLQV